VSIINMNLNNPARRTTNCSTPQWFKNIGNVSVIARKSTMEFTKYTQNQKTSNHSEFWTETLSTKRKTCRQQIWSRSLLMLIFTKGRC